MKTLIIGGVAGGASAAARLRRLNEDMQIIMFERGEYISFANCGLPYYIGGEITEKDALTVQTPQAFKAQFNVDVRVFSEVTAVDRQAKTVAVTESLTGKTYTESYDKLILATGAEPIKPPIEGVNLPGIFTLRTIPDTYRIKKYIEDNKPKTAAVVGGGYIGIEMADNLHKAGLAVTIIEMADQVIAPLDYDMACDIHRHIISKGVRLMLGSAVRSIQAASSAEPQEGRLRITLNNGETGADMLILAIGVRPESSLAKKAGLAVNERGGIIVSDSMRTSDPDIYAVGDAVETTDFITGQKVSIPLAGPANKQGRIAADNICGKNSVYTGTQGSAILKVFDMTAAATGINEKTAKKLGLNYDKSFTWSPSHAGYYPGAVNMSIKTIFEKDTGKILGAQITGFDGADKRCDVFATAIRAGMTAADLARLELCYAPPYSSAKDPVNMAGFVIENLLNGTVKQFHWHDIEKLPRDGSVILLDTRTRLEYAGGSIGGFINIPHTELREHIHELDTNKTVYITCQVGLRGYIAARILMQHGFDVYNLSGGYRLYQSIFGTIQQPKFGTGSPVQTQPVRDSIMNQEQSSGTQKQANTVNIISLNACGLQCPGPIVKLSKAIAEAADGDIIEISTTDPAFAGDIEGFCRRTGNVFEGISSSKGISVARIKKGGAAKPVCGAQTSDSKNIIVFSGDLDKAIASFIIANAAAAMGRKVRMFFTFWGLNIIRRPEKVHIKKDFISRMFGIMMPRGSKKLPLSKMNMGGMGAKMIRGVMKNKNVDSLEDLIALAQSNGVELAACSMSMDVMGIKKEELLDGVTLAGAATMLANAEESDMSLFI